MAKMTFILQELRLEFMMQIREFLAPKLKTLELGMIV